MNEADIIERLNCPDYVGIDVGANYGIFTSKIAKMCRVVHSFEPHPDNMKQCKASVTEQNVVFHEKAVGDKNGEVKLYICGSNPGGHSCESYLAERTTWGHKTDNFIMVEQVRLDDVFEGATDIGFMKIDVEAHEEHVLRGASKLLDTNQLIIALEVHMTVNLKSLYDYMTNKGYIFIHEKSRVFHLNHDYHYLVHNMT